MSSESRSGPRPIETRSLKALKNPMTVLPDSDPTDVGPGPDQLPAVEGVPGVFLVVTTSENVVFAEGRCTCDDHHYRGVDCKHIRRVEFETGRREIPGWADRDAIDDQFRDHIDR